jgi:hypothetical protein
MREVQPQPAVIESGPGPAEGVSPRLSEGCPNRLKTINGYRARIRTLTKGTKIPCATVTPRGSVSRKIRTYL